jgi:hypothetical protein
MLTKDRVILIRLRDRISPRVRHSAKGRRSSLTNRLMETDSLAYLRADNTELSQSASKSSRHQNLPEGEVSERTDILDDVRYDEAPCWF